MMTTALLVMAAPFACSSCGTVRSLTWDARQPPAVYGGTRLDSHFLGEMFAQQSPYGDRAFLFIPLVVLDVPLSVLADTIVLPYTIANLPRRQSGDLVEFLGTQLRKRGLPIQNDENRAAAITHWWFYEGEHGFEIEYSDPGGLTTTLVEACRTWSYLHLPHPSEDSRFVIGTPREDSGSVVGQGGYLTIRNGRLIRFHATASPLPSESGIQPEHPR